MTSLSRLAAVGSRIPAIPLRMRRPLSAALLAIAAVLTVHLLLPSARGVTILVAAHDLAAGAEIVPSDLRTAAYPEEIAPERALRNADLAAGRVLAAPLAEGVPLTEGDLLGSDSLAPGGEDVLMPLRFADPQTASLLEPGSEIRVFAVPFDTPDGEAIVLLDRATVAHVDAGSGGGLGVDPGGTVVTVAINAADAGALAAAGGSALSFALLSHRG